MYLAENARRQHIQSSPASSSGHIRRSSTKSGVRQSTSSLAPSSTLSSRSSYSTPRSSLGYGSPLPQLSEGNTDNEESNHAHWCTYREHSKPINTCEGWKRHEKEHERGFLCMPDGPVIQTRHDRKCALCDTRNPSSQHLAGHNISLCIGGSKGPLKKSRRGDMMKHLALHGVSSPASAILVDTWRFDLNKKAFSCGFCVAVFFSITDRLNHIDTEHWRYGQSMNAWDLSNTIRGLLLQPGVEAAWQEILRSKPYLMESSLRWKLPLADGLRLQLKLEMGEETGTVLARMALDLSVSEFGQPNQEALTSIARSDDIFFDSSCPANRQLAATPMTAQPRSTQNPTYDMWLPNTSWERLRPGRSPLTDMNTSKSELQTTHRSPRQYPPRSFTDSLGSASSWTQPESLSDCFLDLGDNETDLQSSLFPLSADLPHLDASLPPDDNARIQSYLSESEASLVAQVSYPRHEQSSTYEKSHRPALNTNLTSNSGHSKAAPKTPTGSPNSWLMDLGNG